MLKTMTKNRIFFLILFLVAGCAANIITMKQQATQWMDIYNMQYEDTMAIMKNPYATESQKEIGRKKKEILTELWPMLKVYVSIVENGGTPSSEDTQKISDLINRLTSLATGGK